MKRVCESDLNGALGKRAERTLVKTAHIGRCPEKTEVGSGGEPEQGTWRWEEGCACLNSSLQCVWVPFLRTREAAPSQR